MKSQFLCSFLICALLFSCATSVRQTNTYREERSFSDSLGQIISECLLDSIFDVGEDGLEQVSFAVLDLTGKRPVFGGVHADNFIYPASVYKMYVAMEVLNQISAGKYSLYTPYVVQSPNDVDRTSEIAWDPRPLLKAGDTVTIGYLMDLMITRSDNSASNCLIDIAGRENINNSMHRYGWYGSEVTRKFLSRKYEDPGYDTIRGTETNARHAVEFMYKIYQDELVNLWVSRQMKSYLGRQLDTTKLAVGVPRNAMFYHKTGWWSYYTNDVGIVVDEKARFIIALFTPVPEERARQRMKLVAEKVYRLLARKR